MHPSVFILPAAKRQVFQLRALQVNAFFKVNDGRLDHWAFQAERLMKHCCARGAKSVKTDMGSVLAVSKEDVYIGSARDCTW